MRWVHSVLKMTLDYANEDGQLLSRNPSARTKFPRLRQTSHTYLTTSEVAALAEACGSQGDVVLLLAFTGMRFGELVGLRVEGRRPQSPQDPGPSIDHPGRRKADRGEPEELGRASVDTHSTTTAADPHQPGVGQAARRPGDHVPSGRSTRARELEAIHRMAPSDRRDRAAQDAGA